MLEDQVLCGRGNDLAVRPDLIGRGTEGTDRIERGCKYGPKLCGADARSTNLDLRNRRAADAGSAAQILDAWRHEELWQLTDGALRPDCEPDVDRLQRSVEISADVLGIVNECLSGGDSVSVFVIGIEDD